MSAVRRLKQNLRGRDFVVGDIHAHVTRLKAALKELGFDYAVDRLIGVGDLVDRGAETQDILWLLQEPWFMSVMGNHDDLAVRLVDGNCDIERYIQGGGQWNVNNSQATREMYANAFRDLPFAIEVETRHGPVGVVHADCPYPTWKEFTAALEAQTCGTQVMKSPKHEAMWNRTRLKRGDHEPIPDLRALIVGHCTVPCGKVLGNVYYTDTGGWTSRRCFTFVALDNLAIHSIVTAE